MHRSLPAAVLALFVAISLPHRITAAPETLLDRARGCLERHDAAGAVEALESCLADASAAERPVVLDLLRQAYESAASDAEAAGRPHVAEEYRENLEILNRKTQPREIPTTPAPAAQPPTSRDEHVQRSAGVPAKPVSSVPLPSVEPDQLPPAQQPPVDLRPKTSAPASAQPLPAAEPQPLPQAAPAKAADSQETRLQQAYVAFKAARYQEAGPLFGALFQEGQLPQAYLDAWLYCRCRAVVDRVNAKPKTTKEWDEIKAELARIQALNPKFWTAEYLRSKVEELAPKSKGSRLKKIVFRGAAPDEPEPAPPPRKAFNPRRAKRNNDRQLAANDAAPASPPAPNPPPSAAPAAEGSPKRVGNWLVLETKNFRILHADQTLAEKVSKVAEEAREAQFKHWVGGAPRETWTPRCDIYVYPTAKIFSQMTGQPEESPGFSTMGMNNGKIIARRVNVRADHVNIVSAIVPHEVTHVVLADLFPTQQIPRWADEGMAVLSEPTTEQSLRAADLQEPLTTGQLFRVQDLMIMDYPDGRYWALYYAQSVSLTRFLVEQGTPAQFVEFVQGSQRRGHELELRRIYKINGFEDLQNRWVTYAKTQSATASAVAKEPAKEPTTARR